MADLWVFGYGSLMWRPGFAFAESVPARLHGEHRALCVFSFVHRGTESKPGLVLGLDKGGSCRGVAFRIPEVDRDEVLAYLRARELVTNVYHEVTRPVRLAGGVTVTALTYVVDRSHRQYAGKLRREEVLELVRDSAGVSGQNRDYVLATAEHLASVGIDDRLMVWLAGALGGESGRSV
ncbi:cation transport protein ChaC [Kaistia soli DSM 19436]|uniref:glutathione-specific gamma-glutamylcyclotransferase n=1 Tax=Kaistia soli DSM 19436 TaxID=1122133 RepID=A0A1M5CB06_9HYPH|nr:gamma-glutamylcyclotransferase [Kaistia soli]SHF51891.1 cation transport protein ChaC [Kaistia soli DSM 19436]